LAQLSQAFSRRDPVNGDRSVIVIQHLIQQGFILDGLAEQQQGLLTSLQGLF